MCRVKNGELLTNKNQVLARRKDHFEEHLNEGSKSEQPVRPVDLRDDGICLFFIYLYVYLPKELSLTDNFHKFQLKIRLQTLRKQKTKAVIYEKKIL
jgi:hypothetical protein